MAKNKQPSVPGLSPEEQALLQKQGVTLDQFNSILSGENVNAQQNQALLKGISGLYNPDGTINQDQLASLKEKTLAQQQMQEQIGSNALGFLQGIFNPTELDTLSGQAGLEEVNQYLAALKGGDQPLSEGIKQSEAEKFAKLREAAAQRGIKITGDDLFTASSDSTAGNQLLSQLRKEGQLNREIQRENALNRLQSANMQRLGFGLNRDAQLTGAAQGLQYAPGQAQLGYMDAAQQMGPGSLLGAYGNLSQGYGQAAAPYQQQRYLQYQRALQGAANKSAFGSGLGGLGGGIGGAAIGSKFGPYGALLGFGLGSGAGKSLGGLF